MYTTGIVLSGGGMRCMAHLGVLNALEELGIKPDIITGTSAGGIVGAFMAVGYNAEKIIRIIQTAKLFEWSHLSLKKPGLFDMQSFEKVFREHFDDYTFETLPIPLIVNATDISTGECIYFSSGDLVKPLLASCCIPVVFDPVFLDNRHLVDGGVVNNFAVEPLQPICKNIIGIHSNSLSQKIPLGKTEVLDRCSHLTLAASVRYKATLCDLFIEPPDMSRFSMFDFKKSMEIYNAGYEYTMSIKDKVMAFKEQMK